MNVRLSLTFAGGVEPLIFGRVYAGETALQPDAITLRIDYGDGFVPSDGFATVDASTGEIAYAWSAAEAARLAATVPRIAYRVGWTFQVAGQTIEREQYFDVVQSRIRPQVRDQDLVVAFPALEAARVRLRGITTGGGVSSIIDVERRSEPLHRFVGATVRMLTGRAAGDVRTVAGFDLAARRLDVSPDFSAAVSPGEAYELTESFRGVIASAWDKLCAAVLAYMGESAFADAADSEDFRQAHQLLSLQLACEQVRGSAGDRFDEAAQKFRVEYASAFDQLKVKLTSGGTYGPVRVWSR